MCLAWHVDALPLHGRPELVHQSHHLLLSLPEQVLGQRPAGNEFTNILLNAQNVKLCSRFVSMLSTVW
jgi:hypothetical protein